MVKGAGMKLNHYKREKNKTKEFLENWELHTLNSLHQVYILKSYPVILTISKGRTVRMRWADGYSTENKDNSDDWKNREEPRIQ